MEMLTKGARRPCTCSYSLEIDGLSDINGLLDIGRAPNNSVGICGICAEVTPTSSRRSQPVCWGQSAARRAWNYVFEIVCGSADGGMRSAVMMICLASYSCGETSLWRVVCLSWPYAGIAREKSVGFMALWPLWVSNRYAGHMVGKYTLRISEQFLSIRTYQHCPRR